MKNFAVLMLCCLLFTAAGAQEEKPLNQKPESTEDKVDNIDYGLKASFNIVGTNQRRFWSAQWGGSIGGWAKKPIASSKFDFQVEAFINKEGLSYPINTSVTGSNVIRNNLLYINLNGLFHYNITRKISLYAGMGIDVLLLTYSKFLYPLPSVVEQVGPLTYDNPSHLPVSSTIGGSYKINQRIALDIRYRRMLFCLSDRGTALFHFIGVGVEYKLGQIHL